MHFTCLESQPIKIEGTKTKVFCSSQNGTLLMSNFSHLQAIPESFRGFPNILRIQLHFKAHMSLKTASCEAGLGTTLRYSLEIYICSSLIQEFFCC
jgi:hypothetical protein